MLKLRPKFLIRHGLLAAASFFAALYVIHAVGGFIDRVGHSAHDPISESQIAVSLPTLPAGTLKGRHDYDQHLRALSVSDIGLKDDPLLPVYDADWSTGATTLNRGFDILTNQPHFRDDDAESYRQYSQKKTEEQGASLVAGLYEVQNGQILPKVSKDGRFSLKAYAGEPIKNAGLAHVAIVITDLEKDPELARQLIEILPRQVGFALSPRNSRGKQLAKDIRNHGHELILSLMVEDSQKKEQVPELSLRSMGSRSENLKKLNSQLSSFTGYCGVNLGDGGALSRHEKSARPLIGNISQRGVGIFFNAQARHSKLAPMLNSTEFPVSKAAYSNDLPGAKRVSHVTGRDGRAVYFVSASDALLHQWREWLDKIALEGVTLTPACAMLNFEQS